MPLQRQALQRGEETSMSMMMRAAADPTPAPPAGDDLAAQAQALGEALLDAAQALREAPQRPDAQRQALRMLRLVRGWSALATTAAEYALASVDGAAPPDAPPHPAAPDHASAPSRPPSAHAGERAERRRTADGEGPPPRRRTADGGERLVGAAAEEALARLAPQAASWLARRAALTLHVLEIPSPEQARRRTALALRLAEAVQRHPLAPALLHLIRRALNRTPTLALRAEARRQALGLTPDAAAEAIGIPADAYVRYVRSGRGLTEEQRAQVAAWAPPDDPGKRSGEALHAAAPLEEIAARAGMTVDDGRAALEALIADLAPPLRAAGLLDGVRVTRPRRSPTARANGDRTPDPDAVEDEEDGLDLEVVHVWVSPDPPAAQFFTGGWVRLLLAERIRAHAPDADVLIDPVFHRSDGAVFSPALLAVRGDRALVAEPMTVRHTDAQAARLRRLRDLAPLLTDGDPRRLIVVLAPLDDASAMDADGMAQIGDAFGVTVTDLAGADAALAAALAA
jgi:hypothetical protein